MHKYQVGDTVIDKGGLVRDIVTLSYCYITTVNDGYGYQTVIQEEDIASKVQAVFIVGQIAYHNREGDSMVMILAHNEEKAYLVYDYDFEEVATVPVNELLRHAPTEQQTEYQRGYAQSELDLERSMKNMHGGTAQ